MSSYKYDKKDSACAYIKSHLFIIIWFLTLFIGIFGFVGISLYYRLQPDYFPNNGEITTLSVIQRRLINSSDSYDIGILLIVTEKMDLTKYQTATNTLKCYAKLHRYNLYIEEANLFWKQRCPQKDFMFLRHCIVSNLLHRHEWTLFLDADVGVVNPSKLIDTFVQRNENEADIIFFDRFFNQEVTAGSYLTKNSNYAKEFLMRFANIEFSMPKNIVGSDNGAIHWLFLEEFIANFTLLKFTPKDCYKIWENSENFEKYLVFQSCFRSVIGETRLFHDRGGKGTVKLLPKGKAWMRDVWLFENKWSFESDFMLHGLKESTKMPVKTAGVTTFGRWWPVVANQDFDIDSCSDGTIEWKWWSTYIVSKVELERLLKKKRITVDERSFKYYSQIPKFLQRSH